MILAGRWQQRRAAHRPFGVAAELVAVACGPGRLGLQRCRPGGPACVQGRTSHVREIITESFSAGSGCVSGQAFAAMGTKSAFCPLSLTAKIIVQRRKRWIFGHYFESGQSCRDIAACFRILVIRLAPISSSRCELGMIDGYISLGHYLMSRSWVGAIKTQFP